MKRLSPCIIISKTILHAFAYEYKIMKSLACIIKYLNICGIEKRKLSISSNNMLAPGYLDMFSRRR